METENFNTGRVAAMHEPKLLKLKNYKDLRGNLIKFYVKDFFPNFKVKESFYSFNKKNVFRGMHYQSSPFSVNKIVDCFYGNILDFIVDLRKSSKTFKKVTKYRLNWKKPSILFVPRGFAHGYLSVSKISGILYLFDQKYSKFHQKGFNYKSLEHFNKKKLILSKRDRILPCINLK